MSDKTPIEVFAREKLGIVMTPTQVQMVKAFGEGKTLVWPRQWGLKTANKIIREWVNQGATPASIEEQKNV